MANIVPWRRDPWEKIREEQARQKNQIQLYGEVAQVAMDEISELYVYADRKVMETLRSVDSNSADSDVRLRQYLNKMAQIAEGASEEILLYVVDGHRR